MIHDSGIAGLSWTRKADDGFEVGVPPVRACTFWTPFNGYTASELEFGLSATTVTAAVWHQTIKQAKAGVGRPSQFKRIDLGQDAFATPSLAKALVDHRVVWVDTADDGELTTAQLRAVLADAIAAAKGLPVVTAQQVIPACAVADRQAAALLGATPTLRLDYFQSGKKVPSCVWATQTAGVEVTARPVEDARAEQQGQGYDKTISVGGGGGMYLDHGQVFVVSWASSDNRYDVTMDFVDGQHVTPKAATALARALRDLY